MNEIPEFFVPAATSDNQESVYASFADWCNCPIPEKHQRIYSIEFIHDGEKWTATVGEHLQGYKLKVSRSQGKKIERKASIKDQAKVLAIFPGSPFKVVTNHGIVSDVGSAWENPFFVGKPSYIVYFKT